MTPTVSPQDKNGQRSTTGELILAELRALRREQVAFGRSFDQLRARVPQCQVPVRAPHGPLGTPMMSGVFQVVAEGIYRVAFPDTGIEFTVDRLRRERHELHCELSVACGIVGAKVIDERTPVGTLNLSSPMAAQQRAACWRARAN